MSPTSGGSRGGDPNGPPALGRWVLRALLPRHAISDALEGDLVEEFGRRAQVSVSRARIWYLGQVLRLPYLGLHREIRRLRARTAPREVRRGGTMGGWVTDVRVAARSLRRRPGFAAVTIATLALSIGAATLLYSVVDGVLLAPLPYERPDEIVTVYLTNDEWRENENEVLRSNWDVFTVTLDHVAAWRAAPGPLASVAAYTMQRSQPLLLDGEASDDVEAVLVDEGVFEVLGVEPVLGRLPSIEELSGAARVAVLRHETWATQFGGAADVVGRTFSFDDVTYTVIGVMPPGFYFPTDDGGDLWAPVTEEARSWRSYYGLARLGPAGTTADATEFVEAVARRLGAQDPRHAGFGARALPHLENLVGQFEGGIRLLFGAALLVVLVACVNLANLFLARSWARREELAVRASLGAGTGSLAGAILAEVALIAVIGGGLGLLIASVALDPFVDALAVSLRRLPRRSGISLNGSVLVFSVAATWATALLAGLSPTLGAARGAPADALRSRRQAGGGLGARRVQRFLLAAQAALTVTAMAAAALLARSLIEAMRVDMGVDVDRVAFLEVVVSDAAGDDRASLAELREEVRRRVAGVPGVASAGIGLSVPGQGLVAIGSLRLEGAPPEAASSAATATVGPGYFASMGIPILAGRELSGGAGSVDELILSESLARLIFGRADVLGERLSVGVGEAERTMAVVGVVGEARQVSALLAPDPMVYRSASNVGSRSFYVTALVDGDPAEALERIRAAALGGGAEVRVEQAATLEESLWSGFAHLRLRLILMGALAGLAAVLAMVGIAGVVAHFLAQQRRDVGIRMALGAGGQREVRRVVGYALGPTVFGLAVGLVISIGSSRVMESLIFGIEPTDPAAYAAVSVLLLAVAATTAWVPARRTSMVDPARVLNRDGG